MLLRMYLRRAEKPDSSLDGPRPRLERRAGLKSATFIARGKNTYCLFSAEKGVHRLVRLSPSTPPTAATRALPSSR